MKSKLFVFRKSVIIALISLSLGIILSFEELSGLNTGSFTPDTTDCVIALMQFAYLIPLSWLLLKVNVDWFRQAGHLRHFVYSLLPTVVFCVVAWFTLGPLIERSNESHVQYYESIHWGRNDKRERPKGRGQNQEVRNPKKHHFYFHESIDDWMLKSISLMMLIYIFGRIYNLSVRKEEVERSYEKLKNENLQSQISALNNQINPHFFFNALNSLHSIILEDKKEKSLAYLSNLSNLFRYILQSEKKGLVSLTDELAFLKTYRFMLAVKYDEKLKFDIEVEKKYELYKLPVLSLLPIIENVIKHNEISLKHPMNISIRIRDGRSLVIQNQKREKLDAVESEGIGLKNLNNRFKLLSHQEIVIENTAEAFCICLPLLNT